MILPNFKWATNLQTSKEQIARIICFALHRIRPAFLHNLIRLISTVQESRIKEHNYGMMKKARE